MFHAGSKLFITGITGVVGGSLAIRALRSGGRVVALMRDASIGQARKRLESLLCRAGVPLLLLQRIDIVLGDVSQEGLGILSGALHLQNLDGILHCAADIDFHETARDRIFEVNVKGTQRVMELAECLRVPLVYISTAYVCGKRGGLVYENALCTGQLFNNPYEESKCEAEIRVRQWSQEHKYPVLILRPGIVIGDSQTGRITCFNTVYQFMQAFGSLTRNGQPRTVRIQADPHSILSLIPLDHFIRTAWGILETGAPGVYHITHPRGITIGELGEIFQSLFPGLRIEFIDLSIPSTALSREEIFFNKAISNYLPYMNKGPIFNLSNTLSIVPKHAIQAPALDFSLFQRLHQYAVEVNFGKNGHDSPPQPPLAPSLPVQDYFYRFLTDKLYQRLLPNLRKLSAQFRIVLQESSPMHWALRIEEGVLTAVSQNGLPPQCTFVLPEAVFLDIVSGRLSPQYAFFKRMIEIQGDLEKGLSLAYVLSDFFVRYPYRAGDRS